MYLDPLLVLLYGLLDLSDVLVPGVVGVMVVVGRVGTILLLLKINRRDYFYIMPGYIFISL